MYVLIDIGNTRIKLGLLDTHSHTRLPITLACAHSDLSTAADWLAQHLVKPTGAIGASVAHTCVAQDISELLKAQGVERIHWQTATRPFAGLQNGYLYPEKLGVDRWVSAIGLHRHAPHAAFLHVSVGTATTIDCIVPHEQIHLFKGGLILPGPQLMHDSLRQRTAQLNFTHGMLQAFPDHTEAAISSGVAAAQAGAILRQWLITKEAVGHAPRVFCSGGGQSLVEAELSATFSRMCDVTGLDFPVLRWFDTPALDGLAILAQDLA